MTFLVVYLGERGVSLCIHPAKPGTGTCSRKYPHGALDRADAEGLLA